MSNILGNMPPVFGSGYRGVVPAPSAADVSAQNILRADGTWGATPGGAIPSQTGNATKLLTTDGTNASWSGAVTVSGSNATIGGNLTVSGTTASTNDTSGAFQVIGGAGLKSSAYINSAGDTGRALVVGLVAQAGGNFPYASIKTSASFSDFALGIENPNTTAGQGLGLRIVAGAAANDFPIYVRNQANNSTLFSVGGTGNATLAGNLTVSGGSIIGGTSLTLSGGTGDIAFSTSGIIQVPNGVGIRCAQTNNTGSIYLDSANFEVRNPSAGYATALKLANNGNFLIGGTIDSSNGNLQLKDTSGSSTKGIGFGTDTSLYRGGAGQLVLSHASLPVFSLYEGSTNTGEFYSSSGTVVLGSKIASSSLTFRTANTIALTLDSSQRAQFAGNIGLGAAPLANIGIRNSLSLTASGGSAYVYQSGGTLTSAANNDSIFGLSVDNAYSNAGSYTNVSAGHLVINARSFSGFAFGYGLRIGNITGATSNFAIRTGSGIVSFEDTTASTSTTTGALVVSGGVGVAGAVNVGGAISIGGSTYYLLATNV